MKTKSPQEIIETAHNFALKALAGHLYAGEPYDVHNQEVRNVLRRFEFGEEKYPILHAAAENHDSLEDSRYTFGDMLLAGIPSEVASLVYKVTDEPGKNRKERKSKTYPKIASDPLAITLKLADRIANVERQGKKEMYKKEHLEFFTALYKENCDEKTAKMWNHLNQLLEFNPSKNETLEKIKNFKQLLKEAVNHQILLI